MKKIYILLSIFLLLFSLTSCSLLFDFSSGNEPISINYYDNSGNLIEKKSYDKRKNVEFIEPDSIEGYSFYGWTYLNSYQTLNTNDISNLNKDTKEINLYPYYTESGKKHFSDNINYSGPYLKKIAMPSLGSPRILVIPISFENMQEEESLDEIKKVFSGTEEETGWESVNTFYKKSSFNKLDIQFDFIDDWYNPLHSAAYYKQIDDASKTSGTVLVAEEAINYVNEKYNIDFTKYDYDDNGYIDGIWFVYDKDPVFSTKTSSFYWAKVSQGRHDDVKVDGKKLGFYAWASIGFMHLDRYPNYTAETYTLDIDIDAHTFIHETGHILGLEDYYNYNGYSYGGTYGAEMMDYNIGDFSSATKLLLGWIDPYMVTSTTTLEIKPYTTSGDAIMVRYYDTSTIFSQYFIIELYDNMNLNYHDTPITSSVSPLVNHSVYGIRVLSLNASTTNYYNGTYYDEPVDFKYDNSNTSLLFINTVYNKTSMSITEKGTLTDNALFRSTKYTYEISNQQTADSKSYTSFGLKINSISKDMATITIEM